MRYGVFGTGMVGQAIASKLLDLGHEVMMGSRTRDGEKVVAWVESTEGKGRAGTFADTAEFAEIVVTCTLGSATLDVVESAGKANLAGKILIDTTNPLDFSKGMPPTLFVFGDESLGEQVQEALPDTKVVKTFNTVANSVMVDPTRVPGDHVVFLSGNHEGAKESVRALLQDELGWPVVLDLGDITTCRGTEAYLLLWLRLWQHFGTPDFNIQINRKG